MRSFGPDPQPAALPTSRTGRAPIDRFYLIRIQSVSEGVALCHRVVDLLQRPDGIEFTEGAERAVVWLAPGPHAQGTCHLYVSLGALRAVERLGLTFEVTREIRPEELPPRRALVFGEPLDREHSPPRAD